jgi:hypothetical protein
MKTFEQTALAACFVLHNEMLNDESFAGYEGAKDDFDSLYKEVYTIVREELWDGVDVELVVETFYHYQTEIVNGERDVCWFL